MTMGSNRQRRSQMPLLRHLCVCGAHGAILLIVAAYSCKGNFHTWVADAAGQSRTASMLSNENGDGIYENDVDGIVGGRRNRLQIHREKQHRALLPHEEGEVEPSKPSDEVERQDPTQPSAEKARSLSSHGVKGPRKDKVGDVPEDDAVAMGGKKGKKRKETSWDSWDEPEHGKDEYVCIEYALPKSGKTNRSKSSKSEGSTGSADQESNWEKHRELLSNEEVEDVVEEQGPTEADDNLRGKKGPGKKKVTVKEDLVVMAWKEEHGNEKKKKKNHHEPDDEAVCVKWELIIAEIE